jgi:hypothetical protein
MQINDKLVFTLSIVALGSGLRDRLYLQVHGKPKEMSDAPCKGQQPQQ